MLFIPSTQTLFVISSGSSSLHEFNSSLVYLGVTDPGIEMKRMIRLLNLRETASTNKEEAPYTPANEQCFILAMDYVASMRQIAVASSNAYLSFWDTRLRIVRGIVPCQCAQTGLLFLRSVNMLLTWSSTSGSYLFQIWDVRKRSVRYEVTYHNKYITAVCELPSHSLVASSDIDGNLLLWSAKQFCQSEYPSEEPLRLRGHSHAVRSLVYAPQEDLLLAACIEYTAYGWDPATGHLVMHLSGHLSCILKICLLYDPEERALTLDDKGVFKVRRALS
jgi:WD40 repeat protein